MKRGIYGSIEKRLVTDAVTAARFLNKLTVKQQNLAFSQNDHLARASYALRLLSINRFDMAKTSNVFARVEPEVKEQAEKVLNELGIPMSNAVSMFLKQVVLHQGIPFEMKLPDNRPIALGALTKEQFDVEIEKGMADIESGRVYSADEVDAEMKRDFGI